MLKEQFFLASLFPLYFVYNSNITEQYEYKTIPYLCIEVHRNLPKLVGLQVYSVQYKIGCIYFMSDLRKRSI